MNTMDLEERPQLKSNVIEGTEVEGVVSDRLREWARVGSFPGKPAIEVVRQSEVLVGDNELFRVKVK